MVSRQQSMTEQNAYTFSSHQECSTDYLPWSIIQIYQNANSPTHKIIIQTKVCVLCHGKYLRAQAVGEQNDSQEPDPYLKSCCFFTRAVVVLTEAFQSL